MSYIQSASVANVTPSYVFTGTDDPITFSKLNLLATPIVTLSNGQVTSDQLATSLTIQSLTIGTTLIQRYTTRTFSGSITFSNGNTSNIVRIACSGSTASTVSIGSPSQPISAGHILNLSFTTDATGGNVITFGTGFKATGTYTLTGASKYFQIAFVYDGSNYCELYRSGAAG